MNWTKLSRTLEPIDRDREMELPDNKQTNRYKKVKYFYIGAKTSSK